MVESNNDLKYIIRFNGVKGIVQILNNKEIYQYNNDFYFTSNQNKVEINLLKQIIKLLFKHKYYDLARNLLTVNTLLDVTKIKDIKKFGFYAYESYFLGITIKELIDGASFNNFDNDLFIEKVNMLNSELEKQEVIELLQKAIDITK